MENRVHGRYKITDEKKNGAGMSNRGILFYIIGPSGAGKDSLMRYVRARLDGAGRVIFAHRYITRPVEVEGENHVALTEEEFEQRLKMGCFAMHWESHGLSYGIGIEIDQWLSSGLHVVVNGSRASLGTARRKYPDLRAVLISTAPEVLEQRLVNRGRETPDQLRKRLRRAQALSLSSNEDLIVVSNDGPLEEAGAKLLHILTAAPLPFMP